MKAIKHGPNAPPTRPAREASFAECVCLTLVSQGVSHGWALGTVLGPGGEVGRIWSLTRPLTYRAIDGLVDKRLVARRGHASGHGRDRVLLTATAAGRRLVANWLDEPVQHLRDVRTELLVKLALRDRAGLDNEPLLVAQQELFEPAVTTLSLRTAAPPAVQPELSAVALAPVRSLSSAASSPCRSRRWLSARNQLRARSPRYITAR
jgi:PadR family transcriptional regulator AphA